ncbi:MAG: hypothetical protein HYR94_03975 [Chloroflexi bacterium]|nr:hypothetical protein [Chloroflexota bacterium]
MNILKTIPQYAEQGWVDLFFEEGPHENLDFPIHFPFPFTFREDIEGDFLYVVYKSNVIGFARISQVISHEGSELGTGVDFIEAGDEVFLEGVLRQMPFTLHCRGFPGIRYTAQNLHELDPVAAEEEIRGLSLST